jgi:non-ribosomal peptide synthetase component F
MAGQGEYWQNQFAGEAPSLNLPTDFDRPTTPGLEGDRLKFVINVKDSHRLKQLASEENVTLYMVLLAIHTIFLSKVSNREDIVIGTPATGRRHADLDHVIGMFVNTLAMSNYPRGEKHFKEFLKEVKTKALQTFDNQDYQFEDLVETLTLNRDTGRNPLFDTIFGLQTWKFRKHLSLV